MALYVFHLTLPATLWGSITVIFTYRWENLGTGTWSNLNIIQPVKDKLEFHPGSLAAEPQK